MYLKLKDLIPIIVQSTKEASITELLSNSSIGGHIIIEFKGKNEQSKYALGYVDFNHKAEVCFYNVYTDSGLGSFGKGGYYTMKGGVVLILAADESFDKYKIEYYIVPDKYNNLLVTALDDYFT